VADISSWLDELLGAHEERQAKHAAARPKQAVTTEPPPVARPDLDEGSIAAWLEQRSPQPFVVADLLTDLCGTSGSNKADQMRAALYLRRLGWAQSRCTIDGRRAVWWRPVSADVGEHDAGAELVTHLDLS
jgi:hypothetical protein